MKRLIFLLAVILTAIASTYSQVPYFAPTVGANKLYGYTSVKFRPGVNAQETYTTFQYGIGKYFAAGLDLSTSNSSANSGFLIRAGFPVSKWFSVGFQATPSFSLNNSFKFNYFTGAMYLNGALTNNNRLFWVSNTWLGINRHSSNTITQWLYLGYSIPVKNVSITPMAGALYSWKFDADADLAIGAYLTLKNFNFYLWGNDILKSHPRLVIGVDFTF